MANDDVVKFQFANLLIRAVVTVAVLGVGFYVVLAGNYPEATTKLFSTAIGIVIGYWLR